MRLFQFLLFSGSNSHPHHPQELVPDDVNKMFSMMDRSRLRIENPFFGDRLPIPQSQFGQQSSIRDFTRGDNTGVGPVRITPLKTSTAKPITTIEDDHEDDPEADPEDDHYVDAIDDHDEDGEAEFDDEDHDEDHKKKDKNYEDEEDEEARRHRRKIRRQKRKKKLEKENKRKIQRDLVIQRSKYSLKKKKNVMKNGMFERSGALQLDQIDGHSLLIKNHTIKIVSTSYVTERTKISEFGSIKQSTSSGPADFCAELDERLSPDQPKCLPGQVWAAHKNPHCSLTFRDAVFQDEKPKCDKNMISEFSCVCPCLRPFILTYKVEFEINGSKGQTSMTTECQLCRSEKQILLRGLTLTPGEEIKCDRSVRRLAKDWLIQTN